MATWPYYEGSSWLTLEDPKQEFKVIPTFSIKPIRRPQFWVSIWGRGEDKSSPGHSNAWGGKFDNSLWVNISVKLQQRVFTYRFYLLLIQLDLCYFWPDSNCWYSRPLLVVPDMKHPGYTLNNLLVPTLFSCPSIVAMRQKHYLLNDEPSSLSLSHTSNFMLFLPTEHHGPWPSWMTTLVISEGVRKFDKADIWRKYFQIFVIIWPSTKQSNTAVITSTSSVS